MISIEDPRLEHFRIWAVTIEEGDDAEPPSRATIYAVARTESAAISAVMDEDDCVPAKFISVLADPISLAPDACGVAIPHDKPVAEQGPYWNFIDEEGLGFDGCDLPPIGDWIERNLHGRGGPSVNPENMELGI